MSPKRRLAHNRLFPKSVMVWAGITATATLAVLEAHFPGFLDKNLWPASSPDLNPMDFSVWGMLEGKIAGKVFATVDDLKAALEVAWASIDDGYLRRTVNSVKKRLRACVKARGSNFEILL
uniref:Uncharacterized protein n=1 Tax=Caenorhabditis japonica TaxID=281687 RepID=A0A8R1EFH7_CAEJA